MDHMDRAAQVDEEEKLLVHRQEDGSEFRWHILRMAWAPGTAVETELNEK